MTLREFLKEVGVDVLEDTQGTLDLDLVLIAEDAVFIIDKIEENFPKNRLEIKLLDLD